MKATTLVLTFILLSGFTGYLLGDDTTVKEAPEIKSSEIINNDGRESLSVHRGDVVLLEFFKTT